MPKKDIERIKTGQKTPVTIDNDTKLEIATRVDNFIAMPIHRWVKAENLWLKRDCNNAIDFKHRPSLNILSMRIDEREGKSVEINTDLQAINAFLETIKPVKSTATYRAYKKELSRFYNWLRWQHGQGHPTLPMYRVNTKTMSQYIAFIRSPAPKPESYTGQSLKEAQTQGNQQIIEFLRWVIPPKYTLDNNGIPSYGTPQTPKLTSRTWRPFSARASKDGRDYYYGLNVDGVNLALRAINSFYSYAQRERWLAFSPLESTTFRDTANKAKNLETAPPLSRKTSGVHIDLLINGINEVLTGRRESPYDPRIFARQAVLFGLLYYQALRASEAVGARTNQCHPSSQSTSWSMTVMGKGEKPREITLFAEFSKLWDKANQFAGENWPALGTGSDPLLKNMKPYTAETKDGSKKSEYHDYYTYDWALDALKELIEFLSAGMPEQTKVAMRRITPHWLRHARATQLHQHYDADIIRILLGHTSLTTTQRYLGGDSSKLLKAMESEAATAL